MLHVASRNGDLAKQIKPRQRQQVARQVNKWACYNGNDNNDATVLVKSHESPERQTRVKSYATVLYDRHIKIFSGTRKPCVAGTHQGLFRHTKALRGRHTSRPFQAFQQWACDNGIHQGLFRHTKALRDRHTHHVIALFSVALHMSTTRGLRV